MAVLQAPGVLASKESKAPENWETIVGSRDVEHCKAMVASSNFVKQTQTIIRITLALEDIDVHVAALKAKGFSIAKGAVAKMTNPKTPRGEAVHSFLG